MPDGSVCTLAAWPAPTGVLPNPALLATTFSVLARSTCQTDRPVGRRLLDSQMCARSLVAPAATRPALCESNRGAGLFCRGRLVGVASEGFACAVAASAEPGVYTQVRMYDTWIQQQFTRTRIPQAGPTPHPGVE